MSGDNVHEIVIIKRVSGGHEDEHHGGVWKIAFADFMTAMMAFFLVMWLISANDKTKAVIARYFNPVQLVDSTPQPRGLEDPKPSAPSVMPHSGAPTPPDGPEKDAKDAKAEAKPAGEAGKADTSEHAKAEAAKAEAAKPEPAKTEAAKEAAKAEKAAKEENKLFADPYAVLAELAGKDKVPPPHEGPKAVTEDKLGGVGAVGMKGGAAFRDPFEPVPLPAGRDDGAIAPPGDGDTLPPGEAGRATSPPPEALAAGDASPAPEAKAASAPAGSPDVPPTPSEAKAAAKPAGSPGAPAASVDGKTAELAKSPAASPAGLAALRAEVQALAKAGSTVAGHEPRIEVHLTEEGLLIDVTDVQDFAMFGNASARPSPRTVVLMEKIGRLLKAQTGTIVVRGFTDNRPFRSDIYDNWRLSSARADMAHYMLVRGGVDERRFERIEGYADRRPLDQSDGAAPANRRIQVLVRNGKP